MGDAPLILIHCRIDGISVGRTDGKYVCLYMLGFDNSCLEVMYTSFK